MLYVVIKDGTIRCCRSPNRDTSSTSAHGVAARGAPFVDQLAAPIARHPIERLVLVRDLAATRRDGFPAPSLGRGIDERLREHPLVPEYIVDRGLTFAVLPIAQLADDRRPLFSRARDHRRRVLTFSMIWCDRSAVGNRRPGLTSATISSAPPNSPSWARWPSPIWTCSTKPNTFAYQATAARTSATVSTGTTCACGAERLVNISPSVDDPLRARSVGTSSPLMRRTVTTRER